jgi:hypothetical protein
MISQCATAACLGGSPYVLGQHGCCTRTGTSGYDVPCLTNATRHSRVALGTTSSRGVGCLHCDGQMCIRLELRQGEHPKEC